jgi:two-component system response regulator AtoC
MNAPLIVSYPRERRVAEALGKAGYELRQLPTLDQLVTGVLPRPPRLYLLRPVAADMSQIGDILAQLRKDRPLTDVIVWVPQASGEMVRELFRAGARDVIVTRSTKQLIVGIQEVLDSQKILPRLNDLSRERGRGARFESMLSRSKPMWELFELCAQIASTQATVLIVGETGTGKELLARAVHRRSQRRGRFVTANCASIAPELINSELFGHAKGAFTGADRSKKGLVMHANGGTLFLDEIGDMPPEAQQSLLWLLQEKRIRPVGSLNEHKVDVRIVAATNVPLDQSVRDGEFREDLFYRLDVIRMNVPSLRERPEDILFLFGHFTKNLARQYGLSPPTFSDSFLDAVIQYEWPGNVRQLENFTERLVLARPRRAMTGRDFQRLCNTDAVSGTTIGEVRHPRGAPAPLDTGKPLGDVLDPIVARLEREYLNAVLKEHAGRVHAAAQHAGISRRTLLRKMKLYDIDKSEFKS